MFLQYRHHIRHQFLQYVLLLLGHVGLLPQYAKNFKTRGKKKNEREKILNDATSITKAGVFAIVIECVVESLAKAITKKTGARGLRSILESILLKTMYELPSQNNVEEIIVDPSAVKGQSQPITVYSKSANKSKTDKTSAA